MINWNDIKQLAQAAVFAPFNKINEEKARVHHLQNQIALYTNISVEEAQQFSKENPISLEDTLYFASRFGKLPDKETAMKIHQFGISAWLRIGKKR